MRTPELVTTLPRRSDDVMPWHSSPCWSAFAVDPGSLASTNSCADEAAAECISDECGVEVSALGRRREADIIDVRGVYTSVQTTHLSSAASHSPVVDWCFDALPCLALAQCVMYTPPPVCTRFQARLDDTLESQEGKKGGVAHPHHSTI